MLVDLGGREGIERDNEEIGLEMERLNTDMHGDWDISGCDIR
jgi:hypothetical protein